jgi:hypothetical protein
MLGLLSALSPAQASMFTNTFYGTIVTSDTFGDTTTNDIASLFGGGSLLGDSFTLTFTYNNVASGTTSFTGGTYYSNSPNPVTATLTINGDSTTTGNSSDGSFGNSVYNLQAFTWSSASGGIQTQGVVIDLAGLPSTDSLSTQFSPPGFNGFQDCTSSNPNCLEASTFYTSSGETLVLDIQSINGPSPAPAPAIGQGLPAVLAIGGVLFGSKLLERSKRRHSLGIVTPHAAA